MATGSLPTNNLPNRPPKLASATGDVKNTVKQGTDATTKTTQGVTDSVLPGGFPGDENDIQQAKTENKNNGPILGPIRQWINQSIPPMLDRMESTLTWLLSWILPAPRQAKLYEAAAERPASSTFIVCQLICCGVPLLIFFAGVFIFAAVAILLWAVLSLLILGPVLLVASFMGCSLWGWGWLFYGLIRWIDQTYLGGIISRFWLSKIQSEGDEKSEDEKEGEKKE
ncbi:hypothetical protein P170DRAFT_438104 [Aspergillus steynii IBT 23096]|uniref:Uncharacterized protein n=1 Tax=Aspergillus steynii IBT 23096 TaxID=1392250 RepID=A0A2I2G6L1_9EURO|nr:uncharacterized protein P170DRAFT_438104 [Aspergillus steynii IBT 23096]PLB48518.1 hypothetical protein P170DRAFT_438104 [Aspergillus steynii IBT 23096]